MLSHTIKRLETQMGIRLLTRTTRNVAPTEAGERLQQSLAPQIAEIEAEIASLTAYREKPAGRVRITLSDHALQTIVWPRLRPVITAYPDIRIELSIDNGFRNIVEDGLDAGIRLGESIEHDMIAVRIGPDWRLVAVASPGYLRQKGMPQHLKDLFGHNCINMRQAASGVLYAWEFAKDGHDLRVRVEGGLTFNNSFAVIEAALSGHGIGYVPEDLVQTHIAAGSLAAILDDWSPFFAGYYIYYPSRRHNLPAFKVVVDALGCWKSQNNKQKTDILQISCIKKHGAKLGQT